MSVSPLLPGWLWPFVAAAIAGFAWWSYRSTPDRTLGRIRLAMAAVLIILLGHPGIGQAATQTGTAQVDVLLVVDRTVSMSALDWTGGRERLDGVRSDLTAFAAAAPGARFALITFGRDAHLSMPFTQDQAAVKAAIAGIHRENPLDGTGSRPDRPLGLMTTILTRDRDQHPDRLRAVVYVSDGEVTESTGTTKSFVELAELLNAGAVIGYGTPAGARMPLLDNEPGSFIWDDAHSREAVSKIDEPGLRRIAGQMGVAYVHSPNIKAINAIATSLDQAYATGAGFTTARYDLSWILGLLLGGLALAHLRRSLPAGRAALAERRAL